MNCTRQSPATDIWPACDILPRDRNCGGLKKNVDHVAWLLSRVSRRLAG